MKLVVSFLPHIHKNISISRIMYTVLLALLPIFIWAIHSFGVRVLLLVVISFVTACITEAIIQILMKKRRTYLDGSALLTGVLLAFNVPVEVPLWIPVVGTVFAIGIAKQAFGGLGYNFINPALAGRAFLMTSWPGILGVTSLGSVSSATNMVTSTEMSHIEPSVLSGLNSNHTLFNLFFGFHGISVGESSALFILIGGIFLILIKYIDWRIPFSYIMTVWILMQFFYIIGVNQINGIFHILTGGLFLGAFFMATDCVTSPITRQGRWVFGAGCGIITVLIRLWGSYSGAVCYSILLMNCFTPIIERNIRPIKFGEVKSKRNLLLTT